MVFSKLEFKIAIGGDFLGAFNRLGSVFEPLNHVFLRTQRKIVGQKSQSFRIVNIGVSVYKHQNILSSGIIGIKIVNIVSGDQRDSQFHAHFYQSVIDPFLIGQARMMFYFQVKISRSEYLQIFQSDRFGFISGLIIDYGARNFSGQTRGRGDESLRMLAQNFFVDSRFIVESLQPRFSGEFDEILITDLVFNQNQQMETLVIHSASFVESAFGSDVHFRADDRF